MPVLEGHIVRDGETFTPRSFAGLPIKKPQQTIPHINMLIYGDSGVGKTLLASGADGVPEMRNVLVIDMEGGQLSVRKTSYEPDIVRVETWKGLEQVYHTLHAGSHEYQTVIVDSLTEANAFSLAQITTERSGGDELDLDADTPQLQEYGKNMVRILSMLRRFRDLPMNVIFTSLAQVEKQKNGSQLILPDVTGKLAKKIPAVFDNVLYYYVKETDEGEQRCLLTSKTSSTVAKNRGDDALPQVVVVPHFEEANAMKALYNGILGIK